MSLNEHVIFATWSRGSGCTSLKNSSKLRSNDMKEDSAVESLINDHREPKGHHFSQWATNSIVSSISWFIRELWCQSHNVQQRTNSESHFIPISHVLCTWSTVFLHSFVQLVWTEIESIWKIYTNNQTAFPSLLCFLYAQKRITEWDT